MKEDKKNKKNKKRMYLHILKKVLPIHRIIFLILLLGTNTFAWFIYSRRVDDSFDVSIKAWNVVFDDGEHTITNNYIVTLANVYPGMEDYNNSIKVYNQGEVDALFTYTILSAKILGQEYVTAEGKIDEGIVPSDSDITSAQLESEFLNNYPFKVKLESNGSSISSGNGEMSFNVSVKWDYESGNDELDTYWGNQAYLYKESHPDEPCIQISIKLYVTQDI